MEKLLINFLSEDDLDAFIINLKQNYELVGRSLLLWEVEDHVNFLLTYNLNFSNLNTIPLNSIIVHKKSQFNCYYTINGLNALIKLENGGVYDKQYRIDWLKFKNTLITYNNNILKIQKIFFKKGIPCH